MSSSTTTTATTLLATPPRTPHASCSYTDRSLSLNVRFDEECILIPPPPKRPAMVTVSYSLPLWRRRAGDAAEREAEAGPSHSPTEVTFKVPVPRFMSRKPSHSPSRSPDMRKVSPCLVQRAHSTSSASPRTRHAPTPDLALATVPHSPTAPLSPRPDAPPATVPLRACCAACLPALASCAALGDGWTETFSNRAAQRRRRASSESGGAGFRAADPDKLDQAPLLTLADTEPCPLAIHSPAPVPMPIREEDDDQLFPLPSPRRTPTSSPAPSPNASTSNVSVNIVGARGGGSRDSLPFPMRRQTSGDSSDEGSSGCSGGGAGGGRCGKGLLTPEPSPAKAPIHTPIHGGHESIYRPRVAVDVAAASVAAKKNAPPPSPRDILAPSISRARPTASSAPASSAPRPAAPSSSAAPRSPSSSPRVASSSSASRAAGPSSSTSRSAGSSTSTSHPAASSSAPRSPEKAERPKGERRKSGRFSISGQQLWKVGADVLKGVSMAPAMSV
ncbi:hypothetical protein HWV62_28531 [Athelia sp. TMB]|nr:hypothetical protein HWV62_28531 [Athelia sp. TMB]